MCGIVACVNENNNITDVLDCLSKLEYRGYDSTGICSIDSQNILVERKLGCVSNIVVDKSYNRGIILGHTRWATHGIPCVENAHPHTSEDKKFVIIHNGILENIDEIKGILGDTTFTSETDSELIAHLLQHYYNQSLFETLKTITKIMKGTFGLVCATVHEPNSIVCYSLGSPLVISTKNKINWVASDGNCLPIYCTKVQQLNDGDIMQLGDSIQRYNVFDNIQELYYIPFEYTNMKKPDGDIMINEIREQSKVVRDIFKGRINNNVVTLGGINPYINTIRKCKRYIFLGCGSSWHAGIFGMYIFERYLKIIATSEISSEFSSRSPMIGKNDCIITLSQSGETADTIHCIRKMKASGILCIGITNRVASTIFRLTDCGLHMRCGHEQSVAATKSFVSQLLNIIILMYYLGDLTILPDIGHFNSLENCVEKTLQSELPIKRLSKKIATSKLVIYIGKDMLFPIAMEGALKMKEITYIPSEAYAAGELKHGALALVDENVVVIVLCPSNEFSTKLNHTINEIKCRHGYIIAITDEFVTNVDEILYIPKTIALFQPILCVIPLQLMAYHTCKLLGYNVDKPRNLAKSVTVE
jgi:glucosamine--fructose-6-phosphate aminotransferase (isomerizing)